MADLRNLDALMREVRPYGATLVAVSKTMDDPEILEVYQHGHLDFGENYVGELTEKAERLPGDIRWHFIGHLQSNKSRRIVPLTHLIHGVDSLNTLKEINKQASDRPKGADLLIQVHIAREQSKYGVPLDKVSDFLEEVFSMPFPNLHIRGLMGMATFTEDQQCIRTEFRQLRNLFDEYRCSMDPSRKEKFNILSMGMSSDYRIALDEGSTMIRIGSLIFGQRQ